MNIILNKINTSTNIVIITHKSPDGDAIGSSLAFYHFIKKIDKKVTVIVPDSFPNFLMWMKASDKIIYHDIDKEKAEKLVLEADLLFCLDCNGLNRIGDLKESVGKSNAYKIVIDHHQEPQPFANHYVVDSEICSTSQLIYEIIDHVKKTTLIDKAIAECIYCGIMTDTGSFRFPSTTSRTHQIISSLIDKGAEGSLIHQEVYDTYSEDRLRLLGYALTEKMEVIKDCNAAYISLSADELKKYNYKKGDTEGLVNYPLSINGIKLAVLLSEKNSEIRMSFRSKENFYVNEIARDYFEGGGHIYAAGGISYLTLEETIIKLKEIIIKHKKDLTGV